MALLRPPLLPRSDLVSTPPERVGSRTKHEEERRVVCKEEWGAGERYKKESRESARKRRNVWWSGEEYACDGEQEIVRGYHEQDRSEASRKGGI